eukprot:4360435-Lingulodinium_polyedra.AAC.1
MKGLRVETNLCIRKEHKAVIIQERPRAKVTTASGWSHHTFPQGVLVESIQESPESAAEYR